MNFRTQFFAKQLPDFSDDDGYEEEPYINEDEEPDIAEDDETQDEE